MRRYGRDLASSLGEVGPARRALFPPAQVELARDELANAAAVAEEGRAWEREAGATFDGRDVSDPSGLEALLLRGEGLGCVLPSLQRLRDRTGKVGGWGADARRLLDAAAAAGGGAAAGLGGGAARRPTILQVQSRSRHP